MASSIDIAGYAQEAEPDLELFADIEDVRPSAEDSEPPDEFSEGFGERLDQVLDIDTWQIGPDLGAIYRRIEEEVESALQQEQTLYGGIRTQIFPRLADYPGAPKGAGVYRAALRDLEHLHRGLLFNGGVEACDSTIQTYDTLPLTIFQIGVSLVSYLGDRGTWAQRLFRRDLRLAEEDLVDAMMRLLERREQRSGLNQSGRDRLSQLTKRGIMAYAERAILLRESKAPWRMGHGSPAPFELITGSGSSDLMIESTKMIRELVEGHKKFVYVASEPDDRVLLSIGQALQPLEYAIVKTMKDTIDRTSKLGNFFAAGSPSDTHWDGELLSPTRWIRRFRDTVGPQVVAGVYRAGSLAPAQVFYAHADYAHEAAHIALADSVLQDHRGFPLLIDLADTVCRNVFGRETLYGPVGASYATAGEPWRHLSERATRYQ